MEINNTQFNVLQFKFVNSQDDFSKHSIFEIRNRFNEISLTWQWISFANNNKSCIFKETNLESVNGFINLKNIQVSNTFIDVNIIVINDLNKNKRFIHQKKLICVNDDFIMNCLKSQNVSSIIRIKRRNTTGDLVSTGSFILQFNKSEIPELVTVDFIESKIQILENRPMRCHHCSKFGHTIMKCRDLHQNFCKSCHHPVNEDDQLNHTCSLQCTNCKLFHSSLSKLCPMYIHQTEVIKLKETYGLSHQEASRRVDEMNKKEPQDKVCEGVNESNSCEEQLKETIKSQEIQIQNLESTITKIKEENHIRIKNLITKHVKDIQQSNVQKENCQHMRDMIQERNKYLDMKMEHLDEFISSDRTIRAAYIKFKSKM